MAVRNQLGIVGALLLAACTSMSISKLDENADDKVSREEAAQSSELTDVFARADANRDGYLDRTEFQSAREMIREQNRADRRQDQGQHQPRRH